MTRNICGVKNKKKRHDKNKTQKTQMKRIISLMCFHETKDGLFFFHQTELLSENQFVHIHQRRGEEKCKRNSLCLRHAEADVSSTAGRGPRWSERWHSDTPALGLTHPSSPAADSHAATQQHYPPSSTACPSASRKPRTDNTHSHTHTHTQTHTHTHIDTRACCTSTCIFVFMCSLDAGGV